MSCSERQHFAPQRNIALAIAAGLIAAGLAATAAATQRLEFAGAAALPVGAAVAIFLLRHPTALLWMLVFTTPFSERLALNLGGLNVRPYTVLAGLGVFAIIWLFFTRDKSATRDIALYYKGTIALVLLMLASKLVTVFTLAAMPPFMTRLFCLKLIMFLSLQLAASFVVACFIDSPEKLYRILRAWIHVSNIVCLIAIIQLFLANVMGRNDLVWHREIIAIGRPFSVFREPDVLGCFYATVIVTLIPLVVTHVKFISRAYLATTVSIQSLFLILIVVRAAWVAVACCLVLYVVLMFMTRRFSSVMPYFNGLIVLGMLAVAGLTIAAPSVAEKVIERFMSVSNPKAEAAAAYRITGLQSQFKMATHPQQATGGTLTLLMGYGDFSWTFWAPCVIPEDEYDQSAKTHERGSLFLDPGFNMPIAILFDNGIVGLFLYAAFFLAICANFLSTLRHTLDPERQALLIATFLPVIAILICFLFSYDPLFLVLWVVLGIHFAAVYHVQKVESEMAEIGIPVPA